MVSGDCPAVRRQAAAPRGALGDVRGPRHRRDVAAAARTPRATARARTPAGTRAAARLDARRSIRRRRSVAQRIAEDLVGAARRAARPRARLPRRSSAARRRCRPGELQRLRLATQVRSNLFGVVYVLDEPSAGLHPADTEALLVALDRLKACGQLAVRRRARARRDPPRRLDRRRRARRRRARRASALQRPAGGPRATSRRRETRASPVRPTRAARRARRARPTGWLRLAGVTRNNLHELDVAFPLGVLTSGDRRVGLGQVEPREPGAGRARRARSSGTSRGRGGRRRRRARARRAGAPPADASRAGMERIRRLVRVDQKPIGRTPRSNLATYTGLFDHVRKLFAATQAGARAPLRRRALLVQRREGPLRDTARARASSASSCSSCRACTRPARPATARATTRRRSRSSYREQEHRRRARA